ncbi:MAG TPA: Crp/Fnr family transcriptional regulator [Burkholderiaceae bacterium]|nr:Crp/Fnr family transcriptional regulator [Burkholderiaceae bacterium]
MDAPFLPAPYLEVLRRNAWFSALAPSLQESIVRHATIRVWRRGEALFREDEPVRGLGVVLSGRVRFVVRHGDDGETVAHVGGVGCWWGLNAPRRGARAISTAPADGRVEAMVLSTEALERIVDADPLTLRAFAELPILAAERMTRLIGELPGLNPDALLRARLADLAARTRTEAGLQGPVALTISQADLASMIGLSRQRLNQRLRALQDEGLVELGFRRIVVFDPIALRASVARSRRGWLRDGPRRRVPAAVG